MLSGVKLVDRSEAERLAREERKQSKSKNKEKRSKHKKVRHLFQLPPLPPGATAPLPLVCSGQPTPAPCIHPGAAGEEVETQAAR